ncbi:MAG: Uma2 family endonuclease [Planktothrix sp. GU0601_MAG3]|nr:MAG: Uma2 family endonuclease [Planktothrix sp. GU0601_MAG3]
MITITTPPKLSFKDYLNYDDGTDNRYELEDGELILMNPPTGRHALVIYNLNNAFVAEINRLSLSWICLQNIGIRTSINRSRIPDLCIVTREQIQEKLDVSAVLESPAILAIEMVSPESKIRDYRYKRSEYSVVGIPEYWIIDPSEQKITILQLVEGLYEEQSYQGNQRIISLIFPELNLTPEQIFNL